MAEPSIEFANRSAAEFLDDIASQNPTPGGGTAAAMAAAMGYALLEMACAVAGKKAAGTDAARLTRLSALAKAGRAEMLAAMTEDSAAFEGIRAARKRVKDEGLIGDKAAEVRATATRMASGVPLRVARRCAEGLALGRTVLKSTRPATRSDVGVALELFRAATVGAAYNVLVNLDETLPASERGSLSAGAHGALAAAKHDHRSLSRRVARSLGIRRGR